MPTNREGLFVFDLPLLVRGLVVRGPVVDEQMMGIVVLEVDRADIVLLKRYVIVDFAEEGRIRHVVDRGWRTLDLRDCRHSILRRGVGGMSLGDVTERDEREWDGFLALAGEANVLDDLDP